MENAIKLAEELFGKKNLVTAQTKLKLALALCLVPSRKDEGLEKLKEVESNFKELASEIEDKDDYDLLFNLLFEY